MDDSDSGGGDYSNEGRNYSTPVGTPAGDVQSPGGGWMAAGESAPAPVADSQIVTPERTPTAADYANGGPSTSTGLNGGGGDAPNGGGGFSLGKVVTLDNANTAAKTGMSLLALAAGGPMAWLAALSLANSYDKGDFSRFAASFGSAAPSATVSGTNSAGQAFATWEAPTTPRVSERSGSVLGGSPVIGWQGAIVNQGATRPAAAPAPVARPGDFLGFSSLQPVQRQTAPTLAPEGAAGGDAGFSAGLAGLAVGLGLLALAT